MTAEADDRKKVPFAPEWFLAMVETGFFGLRDWKTAVAVAIITFCLDRIMDSYRREAEIKYKTKKES